MEGSLTASGGYVIPLRMSYVVRVVHEERRSHLPMITWCTSSTGLRYLAGFLGFLGLCGGLILFFPGDSLSKIKPSHVPRPEPELKIVDLNIAPTPYEPGNGPLQFSVTVQLPRELHGATILEVTSLISSPSKTSLRFLTHRQPVEMATATHGETERGKVSIELSWDGQDHRKQVAGTGTYSYEVRTKLLVNGEKGLRTRMVAWPKRGTVEVK